MSGLQSSQISDLLTEIPSPWGDAVAVSVEKTEVQTPAGVADLVVRVTWKGISKQFIAEAKTRSIPRELGIAVDQSTRYAEATGLLPMVVLPYIAERQTQMLIERGVSALDLSGNGVIVVPGSMLLCRTGRPNRFRESLPVRFAYRGSTSIIPRVFLLKPAYKSVKEIGEEVRTRGGRVAPSTVSKALLRMEEDVIVRREGQRILLVQPDELLDRLARSYRPSRTWREYGLRTNLPIQEVFRRCSDTVQLTLTGAASMSEYAVGGRGDTMAVYCDRVFKLRDALGTAWEETNRFPDLRVIETRAKELYFDSRRGPNGVVCASEIQTFVELSGGDKRDQQMANQIRERLLANVRRRKEAE